MVIVPNMKVATRKASHEIAAAIAGAQATTVRASMSARMELLQ
jgi:hypothetical protein